MEALAVMSTSYFCSRLVVILLAGISVAGCSGPIGEEFQDVDAIGMSRTWDDWVIVGRFGPNGPFELAGIKECDYSEPCSFSHAGTAHTYDRFHGYKLTILRLESADGEVSHVVLRSEEKQYGAN
jgi:hypothetical protein